MDLIVYVVPACQLAWGKDAVRGGGGARPVLRIERARVWWSQHLVNMEGGQSQEAR
jgi:hypothetical protein